MLIGRQLFEEVWVMLPMRLNPLLVVIVATAVTACQMFTQPLPIPVYDAYVYLNTAVNLDIHGVFSHAAPGSEAPPPDMFFAPAYPAFLAALAKLSPGFADYAACVTGARGIGIEAVETPCLHHVNAAIIAQCVLAVLSSLLVYVGASVVCGRRRYAWARDAAGLGDARIRLLRDPLPDRKPHVPAVHPRNCSPGLRVAEARSMGWAAAGLSLGLLTLTRPSFAYLAYFNPDLPDQPSFYSTNTDRARTERSGWQPPCSGSASSSAPGS